LLKLKGKKEKRKVKNDQYISRNINNNNSI